MRELERWEWAWLAGIFEGEGTIRLARGRKSVQLVICMTDGDVIETVDALCPSPNGLGTYEFDHKKTQWRWQIGDRDVVWRFLEGVMPYLHSRRSARAEEALRRLEGNPGARSKRTHCIHGHPLSGENLYIARTTGQRSCRICRRRRDHERRPREVMRRNA